MMRTSKYRIGDVRVSRATIQRIMDIHEDLAVRRQQLIDSRKHNRQMQICRIMCRIEDSIKYVLND